MPAAGGARARRARRDEARTARGGTDARAPVADADQLDSTTRASRSSSRCARGASAARAGSSSPRARARSRARPPPGCGSVETFYAPALIDWPEGQAVSERVLAKMAYRAKPEGVIALVEAPAHRRCRATGRSTSSPSGSRSRATSVRSRASARGRGRRRARSSPRRAPIPSTPTRSAPRPARSSRCRSSRTTLEEVVGLGVALVAAVAGAGLPYSEADLAAPGRDRRRRRGPRPPAPLASRPPRSSVTIPIRARRRRPRASTPPSPRRSCSSRRCASVVSRDDVLRARPTVERYLRRTPLLASRTLGARLKCELFQRTGSFKARGAINKLASLERGGARARRDRDLGRKPRPGGRLRRGRARRSTRSS